MKIHDMKLVFVELLSGDKEVKQEKKATVSLLEQ